MALSCKETFSLLYYEYDGKGDGRDGPPWEPDSYKLIDRIAADEGRFTSNSEVFDNIINCLLNRLTHYLLIWSKGDNQYWDPVDTGHEKGGVLRVSRPGRLSLHHCHQNLLYGVSRDRHKLRRIPGDTNRSGVDYNRDNRRPVCGQRSGSRETATTLQRRRQLDTAFWWL